MSALRKLSLPAYYRVLANILLRPGTFFSDHLYDGGMAPPVLFLCYSSLIFVIGRLAVERPGHIGYFSAILLINAIGMVLLLTLIGYGMATLSSANRAPFKTFFSIYAYASGTTLVAAWIPSCLLAAEIWRWWLVGIGLMRGGGLNRWAVIVTIGSSVAVFTMVLRSLVPWICS